MLDPTAREFRPRRDAAVTAAQCIKDIAQQKKNCNPYEHFVMYLIPTESNRGRVSRPENCIALHKFIDISLSLCLNITCTVRVIAKL